MLVLGSRGIGAFTAMLLGSVSRYAASPRILPLWWSSTTRRRAGMGWSASASPTWTRAAHVSTFAFEEAGLA